jgi:hypothetical protein
MLTNFWFKFLKNVGLKENAVVVNARPFWNYELDKDSIIGLLAAFSRLYPKINHELNGILNNLPHSIKSRKEFVSELEEWYKQQESCEHESGNQIKVFMLNSVSSVSMSKNFEHELDRYVISVFRYY